MCCLWSSQYTPGCGVRYWGEPHINHSYDKIDVLVYAAIRRPRAHHARARIVCCTMYLCMWRYVVHVLRVNYSHHWLIVSVARVFTCTSMWHVAIRRPRAHHARANWYGKDRQRCPRVYFKCSSPNWKPEAGLFEAQAGVEEIRERRGKGSVHKNSVYSNKATILWSVSVL